MSLLWRSSSSTTVPPRTCFHRGFPGLAYHDLRDVARPSVAHDLLGHPLAASVVVSAPKCSASLHVLHQLMALLLAHPLGLGRLHAGRDPVGVQSRRQPFGGADHLGRRGAGTYADQQRLRGRPGPHVRRGDAGGFHMLVHAVGGAPEGDLPQGPKVGRLKKLSMARSACAGT